MFKRQTLNCWLSVLFGCQSLWVATQVCSQEPIGKPNSTPLSAAETLPEPSPSNLPRWRGFNLLEKFNRDWSNTPFVEDDFRLIHELGFNFVRLPMDYRVWIQDGDWHRLNESALREIDQAVEWGQKYSIHVCINFHRAPGYTVASPAEPTDLWTNAETQAVCAKHWAAFAKRYRGVPNRNLSFNLFNEPPDSAGKAFVPVVAKMVSAIREEDPNRLIISDGLTWGQKPVEELLSLKIAQATRGYTPHEITHYKAEWMQGSDRYPVPQWPRLKGYGTLYAADKSGIPKEHNLPIRIVGPFEKTSVLRLKVNAVSSEANLVVEADGKKCFEHDFKPGPGQGEWKEVVFRSEWNTYQNIYDRDYWIDIPANTKSIAVRVPKGDWLSITEIGIRMEGSQQETQLGLQTDWGKAPAQLRFDTSARTPKFESDQTENREWLWETTIVPWMQAEEKGLGVMVGEFGCHNKTPHDVTLAWMEDCLENWKRADFGWALWNFRGSFGILDSQRADVKYESFHGHQLDRKMLELLQRY